MSARSESVINQKIDYCAIKVEVDFVESVVYVRRDQKRESGTSYVGVFFMHACIYIYIYIYNLCIV